VALNSFLDTPHLFPMFGLPLALDAEGRPTDRVPDYPHLVGGFPTKADPA
jgi:hypothetical protein